MPPISSHQDKERLSFHPMEWGGFLGDLRDENGRWRMPVFSTWQQAKCRHLKKRV
jgi:hypothetical protein